MSTNELLERCQKLPALLRQGQAVTIGRRLGLGQARVRTWLAHEAQRRRVGEQWRYPRDACVQGLLDLAGIESTLAVHPVAAGRTSKATEGAPGSTH